MDALERIKELLKFRNWSIYNLSKASGVSQSTLSKMFKRNTTPTIPTLEMICKGFGISLSDFFSSDNQSMELTGEQREMLTRWNLLTPKQKKSILNLMKNI